MDIAAKVQGIVKDHLGLEDEVFSLSSDLREDLGADSLDRIEMLMACEEAFGIEISDADAQRLATVQDVVTFVAARTATV